MKTKLKGRDKRFADEKWLRYDEPGLRWEGNLATRRDIAVFTREKIWSLIKAKDKFPRGLPELAATKFPSNDLIGYILKMRTVFTRTIKLPDETEVKLVFVSNLSKEEVVERFNKGRI